LGKFVLNLGKFDLQFFPIFVQVEDWEGETGRDLKWRYFLETPSYFIRNGNNMTKF